MCYLTHYTYTAYFHPEEGGYYQHGQIADDFYRLNSVKQARRKLEKMRKELEADGFRFWLNGCSRHTKYIGDGEEWIIEKAYGSHHQGFEPYE